MRAWPDGASAGGIEWPATYTTCQPTLILLATSPQALCAHPSFSLNTFKELLAMPRAQTEKLAMGSSGLASGPHLCGEMLNQLAGSKVAHIPYAGTAPAFTALLGGQIDFLFADTSVLPSITGGKLLALGVTTARRSPALPEVVAMAEVIPGFVLSSWVGIEVPARTPRPVIDRLAHEVNDAIKSQEVVAGLNQIGLDTVGVKPNV